MADQLFQAPVTMALTNFAFAEGSTSTISTTGTNTYLINSKFYSRTALSNQATPTTDWATGLAFIPMPIPLTTSGLPPGVPVAGGYACAFTLGFDSGGNLKAIQGPIVGTDGAGNFIGPAPSLSASLGPAGPNSTANDFCPCGYIVVLSGSTAAATFTFGTTSWTTTGYTTSLGNIATLTGRPLAGLTYS
jgi:hypothetical protein